MSGSAASSRTHRFLGACVLQIPVAYAVSVIKQPNSRSANGGFVATSPCAPDVRGGCGFESLNRSLFTFRNCLFWGAFSHTVCYLYPLTAVLSSRANCAEDQKVLRISRVPACAEVSSRVLYAQSACKPEYLGTPATHLGTPATRNRPRDSSPLARRNGAGSPDSRIAGPPAGYRRPSPASRAERVAYQRACWQTDMPRSRGSTTSQIT